MAHDVHNWGRHEIDILNFEKFDLVLQFSTGPKSVLTGRQLYILYCTQDANQEGQIYFQDEMERIHTQIELLQAM
jgi:hypothetical protein